MKLIKKPTQQAEENQEPTAPEQRKPTNPTEAAEKLINRMIEQCEQQITSTEKNIKELPENFKADEDRIEAARQMLETQKKQLPLDYQTQLITLKLDLKGLLLIKEKFDKN